MMPRVRSVRLESLTYGLLVRVLFQGVPNCGNYVETCLATFAWVFRADDRQYRGTRIADLNVVNTGMQNEVQSSLAKTILNNYSTKDSVMSAKLTREQLIAALNEDLAREYQAIIAYVVYSQVLKGAEYMAIAKELQVHAGEELSHAITIAKQIDYLGGMPTNKAKEVKLSEKATDMLRFDLENENETIRNYRERVRQCEELGEYAIAENIRQILVQEQEHQSDLATALGVEVPDVTKPEERA